VSWFDEQGIPGGSIAPIESGYAPRDLNARMKGGTSQLPTMDVRTGGDVGGSDTRAYSPAFIFGPDGWSKSSNDPNTPWQRGNETLPIGQSPYDGMFDNLQPVQPGQSTDLPWDAIHRGIERPVLPTPDQGGSYPLPTQDFRRGGDPVPAPGAPYMPPPQGGTLGAVGMGQSQPQSFGQRIMAGNGGRNALSGAFGGMFGGGGSTATSALGFGQAPTAALQSTSGYGGGRQLGGFAGGGGSMLRSPTGVSRQVARSDVPFYLQRGATEVR
jgi:hypothetical protein